MWQTPTVLGVISQVAGLRSSESLRLRFAHRTTCPNVDRSLSTRFRPEHSYFAQSSGATFGRSSDTPAARKKQIVAKPTIGFGAEREEAWRREEGGNWSEGKAFDSAVDWPGESVIDETF